MLPYRYIWGRISYYIESFTSRVHPERIAMRRAFEAIIFIACYLLICVNCLELKPPTPRLGARANSYRRSMQPRSDEASGSRRKVIARVASLFLGSLSSFYLPSTSLAAQPVTLRETDSLGAMARRSLRPKPPKCLRRKLSQDFAVLLMRSSYNSLDLLDCVAMVRFNDEVPVDEQKLGKLTWRLCSCS